MLTIEPFWYRKKGLDSRFSGENLVENSRPGESAGKNAEKIFENRFAYTNELIKMGADINLCDNTAIINGTDNLCGTKVKATDLRGGGALVMAGVFASGQTEIANTHYISRGYGQIVDKLKNIGVDIKEENNS